MFPLTRWSPSRELESIRRDMDQMMRSFFGRTERWLPALSEEYVYPRMDCVREGENLKLHVALPGVDPKDIDLTVTGNLLTVKGHMKHEKEVKEEDYFFKEIGHGEFERSVTLPVDVEPEQIKASYANGILEILLPAKESVKGKKIEIAHEEGKKELKAA